MDNVQNCDTHLCPSVNQTLLWINKPENPNFLVTLNGWLQYRIATKYLEGVLWVSTAVNLDCATNCYGSLPERM
jgi:hypothetical protein